MPKPSRVLYTFSPKRAYLVEGIFLAVLGTAAYFMVRSHVWPLAAVFGFLSLRGLWKILTTPRVQISLDLPYCVYSSRSILRKKQRRIFIGQVKGATSRIVSMWRGNITEKMVLETHDGKELLLNPVCSSNSSEAARIHAAASVLLEAQEEYREQVIRETLEEEKRKRPERKKVERTLWGMLEMSVKCPSCDAPVPVNGPWTRVQCMNCLETVELSEETWADLLEDVGKATARELEEGEGSNSAIMGVLNTTLLYARMKPYCPECKKDFDMDRDLSEDRGKVTCSGCGESLAVIAPPEWFHRVYRKADMVVGATRSAEKHGDPPEPVVLTCASCGAAVGTVGETRNAVCGHCGTSMFLPDDLWYVFHPAPVKRRWFTRYSWRFKEET